MLSQLESWTLLDGTIDAPAQNQRQRKGITSDAYTTCPVTTVGPVTSPKPLQDLPSAKDARQALQCSWFRS